jgi:hypothetical protein
MPELQDASTSIPLPSLRALNEKTNTKSIVQGLDRVMCVVCWNTMYEARNSRVPLSN